MKIGVLGNDDFVMGFKLAGIDREYVTNGEILPAFDRAIRDEELGVLIMHERDRERLPARAVKSAERLHRPIVVTISEKGGRSNIQELIRRCIGVDLWK